MKPGKKASARMVVLLMLIASLTACSEWLPPAPVPTPFPTITQTPTATNTIVWFPPTATPTVWATLAPEPTFEYQPGVSTIIERDTFQNEEIWTTVQNSIGSVAFGNRSMDFGVSQNRGYLSSMRQKTLPANFELEITASANLCQTNDSYGLLIRAATQYDGYRYLADCNGRLRLERLQGGGVTVLVDWTYTSQLLPGSPQSVRLGVWASGSDMRFFANDVFVFGVRDSVYPSGKLGIFVRSGGDKLVSVSFSELEVRNVEEGVYDPIPTRTPTATPSK